MTMRRYLHPLAALAVAFLAAVPVHAQEGFALEGQNRVSPDTIGYFLGVSVGQSMTAEGFRQGDFDLAGFSRGLADALAEKEPALNADQLRAAQQAIQNLLVEREQEMQNQKKTENAAFMQKNASTEGVKTLDGGVQYKVLSAGSGESPAPTDTVKVHYTGTLTNGQVFDSSVQRGQPASFQVQQVIQGWQQALQKMKVGDKWMLYIPPELAYGESGRPPVIGPNEILIFEVELLDIL